MPKRGLRLEIDEYNHVVHHRYLAKKRKDHESRVGLRALLPIHEGKALEPVGQILEVARSTVQRWIEKYRRNGFACARTIPRKETQVKSGPETGTGHHGSTGTGKQWFGYWSLDWSNHSGFGQATLGNCI